MKLSPIQQLLIAHLFSIITDFFVQTNFSKYQKTSQNCDLLQNNKPNPVIVKPPPKSIGFFLSVQPNNKKKPALIKNCHGSGFGRREIQVFVENMEQFANFWLNFCKFRQIQRIYQKSLL
eukprot:TRINITY_DN5346_c2_g1_i1.p2 TRINITY_DN5346_c2_g1~~TRINITY_DN5346_c2_g1_i1.p2  ORF type:complete len:120 (-),score=0.36 TRINITY_DN5346_c2_g1_i1:167-526(-)